MFCKKCKNELAKDAKFCGKCSQKVDAETKSISKKETGKKKSLLAGVVVVIAFILAFVVFRYLIQEALSPSSNVNTQNSSYSQSELISDTVKEIKSTTALPTQLDEVTVWNDVTAQPNAIRYHYTLSGVDTNSLSNSYLKSYLGPTLCQNQDTRYLLDQEIGMEYSYLVENSAQSYFISFTKADCLQ